jgi:hypothetical protein
VSRLALSNNPVRLIKLTVANYLDNAPSLVPHHTHFLVVNVSTSTTMPLSE